MSKIPSPLCQIIYEKKDITASIAPYVVSVTYTDFESGQSDEVEIQIEDKDNLWKVGWYPSKGDTLRLNIGYSGERLLNCGSFETDELEFASPPDTLTIKALAASIKKALRQKNSVAYENKTLKQIAQGIANKHGYKLIANIQDVKIKRITQNNLKDLTFLKNLAEEYGYIFKITDNKLVFYETEKLKGANSAVIFNRTDLISFNIKDKASNEYKACEVSYHDPKTKKLITTTVKNASSIKGDTLKIHKRCENKEQANLKATAALNNTAVDGSITVIGNQNLVAGINVELKGLYHLSGKYHVTQAKHTFDRQNGYTTELEIKRC